MGQRGRKPKPVALKILTGNPGKRPLNLNEPKFAGAVPVCPEFLHEIAKDKWRELVALLHPVGLLTEGDGEMLAGLCQAWAEFRLATETLEKEGRYTKSPTGYRMAHPAISQQRQALRTFKEFSTLFGLDPSSRGRLNVGGPPQPDDEIEGLLNAQ